MLARKASITLGCLVLGAMVVGMAADQAQAQCYTYYPGYSYYPAYTYVAPAPVVVAPAPVVVAPAPVYCPPPVYRSRSFGFVSYGHRSHYYPRHYGHHGRSFSFGFSYRH